MHFIVTPTYNERNNARTLINKIFSLYPDIHVLVVDDNSPDGTADAVKELQGSFSRLYLMERPGKQGLASAYKEGFEYIFNAFPNVTSIITMDADLSHDPSVIADMTALTDTHDLIVGSRYVKNGRVKNWELWRQALSRGGNAYARTVTMSRVKDLTAGFVCYRADLLKKYDLGSITSAGYGFQIEMKILAERLGARVKEVPIVFPGRSEGESKLSGQIIQEGLIMPWKVSPLAHFFSKRKR